MVRARLRGYGIADEYVVMHVGAGSRPKEWPLDRWQEAFEACGHRTAITGIITPNGNQNSWGPVSSLNA